MRPVVTLGLLAVLATGCQDRPGVTIRATVRTVGPGDLPLQNVSNLNQLKIDGKGFDIWSNGSLLPRSSWLGVAVGLKEVPDEAVKRWTVSISCDTLGTGITLQMATIGTAKLLRDPGHPGGVIYFENGFRTAANAGSGYKVGSHHIRVEIRDEQSTLKGSAMLPVSVINEP